MNNITKAFKKNKLAKIIYITCGYPDLSSTIKIIFELEKIGVDIIELGIPFSDPVADGIVIQATSQAALKHKYSMEDYFLMVKTVRKKTSIPLVIMTYSNIIYHYGYMNFIEQSKKVGIDGFIIPDLPLEESKIFSGSCKKLDLANILIASETTSKSRLRKIASLSTGFVYVVSQQGITGKKFKAHRNLFLLSEKIRKLTSMPIAVGFGISSKDDINSLRDYFNGVIIGSAFLKQMLAHNDHFKPAINFLKKIFY